MKLRESNGPRPRPRLLVSVRNVAEAKAALAGGCDVLDLKEPGRGPLGMADGAMIAAVFEYVQNSNLVVPLSVALGEAVDWKAGRPVPRLPARIAFLKLGTAGMGSDSGWGGQFGGVRQRFVDASEKEVAEREETAGDDFHHPTNWIAVGYADWEIACGPAPEAVIETAAACGCAGVLIDTFSKESGGLFSRLTSHRLESLAALARSCKLSIALAGRLFPGDIPQLLAIGPEIVGIRSAACRGNLRTGDIDAAAVRAFGDALHRAAQPQEHP